jgi:hypothetical protein
VTDYTRPERATEIKLARRQLAKIHRDPCAYCTHREEAFGKSICPTFGRSFPLCTKTPGLQFDIDHAKLQGDS